MDIEYLTVGRNKYNSVREINGFQESIEHVFVKQKLVEGYVNMEGLINWTVYYMD